eukprot:jgi/Ulvmu1/9772/UM056_0012.1
MASCDKRPREAGIQLNFLVDDAWSRAILPQGARYDDVHQQCCAVLHEHALRPEDYTLLAPDGSIIDCEVSLQRFRSDDGRAGPAILYWQPSTAANPNLTAGEEVSFVPHPKTMTKAGEWEYFAAGSQHPFPYAVAELIDNSLRATRHNKHARKIVVTLVSSTSCGDPAESVVSVWDNGCGMSMRQLNEWAVMNLTMEDRGLQPREVEVPRHAVGTASARQLCSDLSYFGVGSKNAAFFMGRSVKVSTKSEGNALVHEMCINADALEQRYKTAPDQVYRETITKRMPAKAPVMVEPENGLSADWIRRECEDTFTRVTVADIKPDILEQFQGEEAENVCRQLAHLYHYYLHGPLGNPGAGSNMQHCENSSQQGNHAGNQSKLPTGDLLPTIVVQYCHNAEIVWSRDLRDVQDDLESLYLAAKGDELSFALDVPGKGNVEGTLWYFPYKNDAETVPRVVNQFIQQAQKETGMATQAFTQAVMVTQAREHDSTMLDDDIIEVLPDDDYAADIPLPVFEVFWQGRLIPGTSVASIPFLDALRAKMAAAVGRPDNLPDECFTRLRGALFLGPSWTVTRNKLKLRDNIDALLANAIPHDRQMEKTARAWLHACHQKLDKTTMYDLWLPEQQIMRKRFGEQCTFFGQMSDGCRTIEAEQVVLCESKQYPIARVICVGVNRILSGRGTAAGGFAVLKPLPEVMWGSESVFKLPLRKVALPESEENEETALLKEQSKLPHRLEMATKHMPKRLFLDSGRKLQECSLEAVNSDGKKVSKQVMLRGKKQPLTVVRIVFQLEAETTWPLDLADVVRDVPADTKARGKKAKAAAAAAQASGGSARPTSPEELTIPGATKVLVEEAAAVRSSCFEFKSVKDPIKGSGRYGILYLLQPVIDPAQPIAFMMELIVCAGQPVVVDVSGAGPEFLASSALHLGQELPPVAITLRDDEGNPNYEVATDAIVEARLLASSEDSVPADLELTFDVSRPTASQLQLTGVRIQGNPGAGTQGNGLPSFAARAEAMRSVCQFSQVPALDSAAVELVLQITVNSLSTSIPVKLLPGVPVEAVLGPDNPFHTGPVPEDVGEDALLEPGAALPPFTVWAADAHGNPCVPSLSLQWKVELRSATVTPCPGVAAPDALGAATLHNVHVSHGVKKAADWSVPAELWVVPVAVAEGLAQAAAEAEAAAVPLGDLKLLVAPSRAPAAMTVIRDEDELAYRVVEGPEGESRRAYQLGDVAAGSSIDTLSFGCIDEVDRPVAVAVKGKVMCGWMRKARTAAIEGDCTCVMLPKLKVPQQVGPKQFDMRFWDQKSGAFDIEATLAMDVVAGPPSTWQLCPIEGESGSGVQVTSEGAWSVKCGQEFTVALELSDEFGNKCSMTDIQPEVDVVEAEETNRSRLATPGCSLDAAWQDIPDAEGGSVTCFVCRISLCGEAGPVALFVPPCTPAGSQAAAIAEIRQPLELTPGDPARLRLQAASLVQYGAGGCLGDVTITAVDASDNPSAPAKNYEVTLRQQAAPAEGTGAPAKAASKGSNRCRMANGEAVFNDVQLSAEGHGLFELTASCKSRPVALEGSLTVEIRPSNAVLSVRVDPASVPMDPVPAGTSLSVSVLLETEDQAPLSLDDARQGLTLNLIAPGANSKAAQIARPTEASQAGHGVFSFSTGALTTAGAYTIVAEWSEHRMGVPLANARSPATSVPVTAGPPADARISLSNESLATLAVGNGQAAGDRVALRQLVVQLLDEHGNCSGHVPGAQVRVVLCWQEGSAQQDRCELPRLLTSSGVAPQKEVNMNGAVSFGDIVVDEGSGRAQPNPAAGSDAVAAMNLDIKVQLVGVQLDEEEGGQGGVEEGGWQTVWEKEVMFSDDAQHMARVVEYTQVQRKHAAQAQAVQDRAAVLESEVAEAQAAVDASEHRARQAAAAAAAHTPALAAGDLADAAMVRGRLAELAAAQSLAAAAAAAAQAATQRSDAEAGGGRSARYGNPTHPQTAAVKHALGLQRRGVHGAFAQLGSVQDTRLSELLSASMQSTLRTLVVDATETRIEVSDALREANCEVPDILALPMCSRCTAASESPHARCALDALPEPARGLVQAASHGAERALLVPLPHTQSLARLQKARRPIPQLPYGGRDWPPGCVDYAFNLVRPTALPAVTDLRATVFWTLFGRTLVFTTLAAAEAYRDVVVRQLGGGCSDILTLDGGRLRGNGIVCGSSFSTEPLSRAKFRFAQLAPSQGPLKAASEEEAKSLQAVLEALEDVAQHAEVLQQAKDAAELHRQQNSAELQRLEAAVGELDDRIKKGTKRGRTAGGVVASQPRRNARKRRAAQDCEAAIRAAGLEDDF